MAFINMAIMMWLLFISLVLLWPLLYRGYFSCGFYSYSYYDVAIITLWLLFIWLVLLGPLLFRGYYFTLAFIHIAITLWLLFV